tara:strand:+ start:146 stop:406 length:261 start_codon:yes stop_codon:yes gene_type:complete
MKTITVTLNKKTIQSAYSEMKLLKMIGAGYAQGDSPMIKLLKEIKRDINKQHKQKMSGWKEFFHFWPLSIMVPLMLLSIILGPLFQ